MSSLDQTDTRFPRNMPVAARSRKNAFDKSCRYVDRNRGGIVPDQPVYSHGLQHQNDFERRSGRRCLRLAVAGRRIMAECNQFPAFAMTGGR